MAIQAETQQATNLCKKLYELPSVFTDWQETAWCPDCEYYTNGRCSNPNRTDDTAACPFDGKALPLREVDVESNDEQALHPKLCACKGRDSVPRSRKLDETVTRAIMTRTRGRIRSLEVEVRDNVVVIRGRSSCFYIKQLALQAALDAVRAADDIEVQLEIIVERPVVSGTR